MRATSRLRAKVRSLICRRWIGVSPIGSPSPVGEGEESIGGLAGVTTAHISSVASKGRNSLQVYHACWVQYARGGITRYGQRTEARPSTHPQRLRAATPRHARRIPTP